MKETYTPRPVTTTPTTLATQTMDGMDVLIVKEGPGIWFHSCAGPFTPAAWEECMALAFVHQLALEAPATPAPAPPVKPKGLLGWLRTLAPQTPRLIAENASQQVRP